MTDVYVYEEGSFATAGGGNIDVSEGYSLVAVNFPTESIDSSNVGTLSANLNQIDIQVGSMALYVATRGRIYNPTVRAFTFQLDAHEYYAIRLSDDKTLVYDILTSQWSWWSSEGNAFWRVNNALNWRTPGLNAFNKGSNIVLGDDTVGVLWMLDPEQGFDDTVPDEEGNILPLPFIRRATGQMITRGRATVPVYEVYLTATAGEPAFSPTEVDLLYSDDLGKSFLSAGLITVEDESYNQEFAWRSLGLISAPGRLFAITDMGAFARIDSLDVHDTQD